MGYLRKYLQQVGLVSTLLFVGAMGGLMAPLSSQAGTPSLTVLIDGQPLQTSAGAIVQNSSILGAKLAACSAADRGLGYTDCYAILTSTTVAYKTAITAANPTVRLYRIQNATGATARLRVGDNLGQDFFSLVGVQFVPVNTPTQAATVVTNWDNNSAANTNEAHILTITMKNKFDAAVNVGNATGVVVGSTTIGQVAFGIASGGEFRSAPLSTPVPTTTLFCTTGTAAARCSTVGDNVTFTGTGIFSGTTSVAILSPAAAVNNSRPLSLTVGAGNANNSIVGYAGLDNATLGQVNPEYPKFVCKDPNALPANTKCQPDITLTMTATLKGPDTFVLLNGANAACAICNFAQNNNRLTQLFTLLSQVIAFLDWWENTHTDNQPLRDFITNAQAFLVGFNGPPADPDCAGAKSVQSSLLFESLKNQVTIAGDGGAQVDPAPATGTITITKNTNGETGDTFTFNIIGPSPSTASIPALIPMGGMNSNSTVVTVNAGTYNVVESPQSGWNLTAASCNGDNTNGVTVLVGGNVACNFTNSSATSNDLGAIRLTWGATPSDLDSHLYVPNGFEVAYFSQGSLVVSPFADLDLDDVTGFGPENITVVKRMKGTYQYFVHNFSQTFSPGMTGSPAKVELIRNGGTTTYDPPPGEGTNLYWHVFNAVVDEACAITIVPVNVWSTSPPMRITTTTTENLCP